jgi:hypothetical protein
MFRLWPVLLVAAPFIVAAISWIFCRAHRLFTPIKTSRPRRPEAAPNAPLWRYVAKRRDRKPGAICGLNDYLGPYASVIQRLGTAVFSTDLQGLR